jgi:hypothetical protein
MKQQKNAIVPATPAQQAISTKALSFKGEIVAYHQAATKAVEEAMESAFQCGRLLEDVKAVLKADKTTSFGKWVEQFCGFSERSAFSYCSLYNNLRDLTKLQRAAVFKEHQSQRAVAAFLTDQRKTAEPKPDPTVSKTETVDEPIPTSPPPASQSVPVQSDAVDGETLDGSGGGGDDPLDTPEGPPADLDEPPEEPTAEEIAGATDAPPAKGKGKGTPPVSGPDTKALYKEWDRAIGPLVRLVDRIAGQVNGKQNKHHKCVQEHLNYATEEMMEWLGVDQ